MLNRYFILWPWPNINPSILACLVYLWHKRHGLTLGIKFLSFMSVSCKWITHLIPGCHKCISVDQSWASEGGVAGKVGTILNWIAAGNVNSPTVVEKLSLPEFPYVVYAALFIESQLEKPLWRALQNELSKNPSATLETCTKVIHIFGNLTKIYAC